MTRSWFFRAPVYSSQQCWGEKIFLMRHFLPFNHIRPWISDQYKANDAGIWLVDLVAEEAIQHPPEHLHLPRPPRSVKTKTPEPARSPKDHQDELPDYRAQCSWWYCSISGVRALHSPVFQGGDMVGWGILYLKTERLVSWIWLLGIKKRISWKNVDRCLVCSSTQQQ